MASLTRLTPHLLTAGDLPADHDAGLDDLEAIGLNRSGEAA